MAKPAVKAAAKSTAITKFDAELAKLAQQATEVEKGVGSGSFLSTKSGVLQYQGANVPNNEMEVVVLDHVLHNAYYEGEFDPDNPSSPVCYAFGRTDEEMRPHTESPKPQNETCAGCPQNEFGTADRGKGKACKNTRRLALIAANEIESAADIKKAEVAYYHPQVTSCKGWAGFVRQVANVLKRPPLGVVTLLKVQPHQTNQVETVFSVVEEIGDGNVLGALIERGAQVAKEIIFPYQKREAATAAPKGRAAKGRNVVPARKKKFA